MTTFSTQPNLWSDSYEPSSSPEYSTQPIDILLYFTLAFMGLAVFSFCLQIALNIHREVRATRHQETNQGAQDPENRIASRPLSLAQVKTFPIKVYVSPAALKQKLRDRVAREQQRGESVPGTVAIPVVDGNLVDEENEEAPCCSVCLEDFVEYEVLRELPCKHLFHRRCIDPWLGRSSLCPTCRFNALRKIRCSQAIVSSSSVNADISPMDTLLDRTSTDFAVADGTSHEMGS
ncbi:hypothetical protein HDU99_000390 [Rhizoclosmatium hyalinum]|nr:hypothetical protein HDU99_000390 [Rhizoclosmatium hyalinum]